MARAPRKTNGRGIMPMYQSYMFKDKDPVIDELRTLAEDAYGKRISNASMTDIHANGGPSTTCMRAWWFGKTRRPTSATVEAAGRAMGFMRVWRKMTKSDLGE